MRHIIISSLFLAILLAVSVFVFDPSHLYYELPWLDIPMHILGGFGVASLAMAIFSFSKIHISYVKVFIFFCVIAVAWELYEYIHDLVLVREWNGWQDTIKDLVDGAIGMSLFYFCKKK